MSDVCFVSVAFGERYLRQMDRLRKSILKIYPDANLLFFYDCLPKTATPFLDSLYGFKPHAVREAKEKGFKKVIWLDPAMVLMDKVDDLIRQLHVIAVRDDSALDNLISNKCCLWFNITRKQIKELKLHLVGGSLYFFNFNSPLAVNVLDRWLDAEMSGIFGNQWDEASGKQQGHRADETVMALCLYEQGLAPVPPDMIRYCIENNPMWIKKHFK